MEGNQQKMREAIVALIDALDSLGCDEETATLAAFVPDMADSSEKCLAAFRKAKEALSAPPRNCDIYPKRDDAGEAWNKTLDERTRDMVQRYPLTAMDMFIDWLLAYAEDGGAS